MGQTGSKTNCPEALQQMMVMRFEELEQGKDLTAHCSAILGAIEYMAVAPETTDMIMNYLESLIEARLVPYIDVYNDITFFSLGAGLKSYAQLEATKRKRSRIWPAVYRVADRFGAMLLYLEAVLVSVADREVLEPTKEFHMLIAAATENLHSSSHPLRQLSLQILEVLHAHIYNNPADTITTALRIENSPLDLQSARSASLNVRKLSAQYKAIEPDSWVLKIVPQFCFGLLSFKLSQLCNDAVDVMKVISSTKAGEDAISTLAFAWLENYTPLREDSYLNHVIADRRRPLTPFQCSNLSELESMMSAHEDEMSDPDLAIDRKFHTNHHSVSQVPAEAPTLALKVLKGLPHLAEKRSRQLVPIFLRWAASEQEESPVCADAETDPHAVDDGSNAQVLARKDRKAMMDLFGHFTNPRVLYRASEVYKAFLGLVASGDVTVQKSALQALFAWKSSSLILHQANLMNLLDDLRFREEVSVFVNVDKHESIIEDEQRQELMPVLLRILYGKVIARSGPTGRRGQGIKRRAVLEALARFEVNHVKEFVSIALGPLASVAVVANGALVPAAIDREYLDTRKQVGLINMMKDMLETLGDRLAPLSNAIMDSLLYCSVKASRSLNYGQQDLRPENPDHIQTSMLKDIRQIGLQCLTLVFRHFSIQDLECYLPAIFSELINPRLEKLAVETSQSISGLLQLFSVWASSEGTVTLLTGYDTSVLGSIVACLNVESAKNDVKLFVLEDILSKMVRMCVAPSDPSGRHKDGKSTLQRMLDSHMDYMLKCIGDLLHKSPSREILESAINLIAMLVPVVEGSSETRNLLEISTFLLDQPSHRVKPKSKGHLLHIVEHFVPLLNWQMMKELQDSIFRTISSLFGFFRDRINRQRLSSVMAVLADQDEDLRIVANFCTDLNAFSLQRVDEPDFELRLKAFSTINESQFQRFTSKQWRPIIYNMLFFIRDQEELAIRSNASFTLRRFVEVNNIYAPTSAFDMVKDILLPALRSGIVDSSELVRAEYLSVMAHLIRCNLDWEEVNDMSALLCNDDEEASFFSNVLHIQQHRRLRALRRLAVEARKGGLRSANVAHFFVPLIEHFIFDRADDESAHNLSAETVTTVGALAQSLEWPQFRAMFRRFSGYIQSKPDLEKTVIKLIGIIIDALNDATVTRKAETARDHNDGTNGLSHPVGGTHSVLVATMPKKEKLIDDLVNNLLPSLVKYLHHKDESTVSLRVPVAVSIVKLLKLLPATMLKDQLAPVLTDVCNILRSRAQESRDLTRKTLVEISVLIGPGCFGFVLKELRSSLMKGYQLHVLSYTVHAILVATASVFRPGELDYCLPQIVAVIMDDIFGATGQEKDAEEYISKMKEVKSSKSYDSMELMSKITSIESFVHLITPLQNLLRERLDMKLVKKIDELLRRVGVGLLRNEAINDHRSLVFCHEMVRETYKTAGEIEAPVKEDYRTKRFLIKMNGASKHGQRGSTSSYNYKLVKFSVDLLRSILHKYEVLQTPANIQGFMPIIGDSIVQSNEEIQVSAIRLLTTIIKVPLKDIDENAGVYISECVKIIKASTTSSSELAQAALKLVSSVLRERKRIEIRETDLAYLLRKVIPDLEAPDRQGVAFNFLKAILIRKVVITEVYEALDTVAAIMVTNQTKGTRDVARSVYFQFIQDYPQGKGRFTKQMAFLAKNLNYKHQEGRQSILEAIHLFFLKIGDDLIQDILGTFFVPLVMVMINDESVDCREMAGTLVKTIFSRADSDKMSSFLTLLRSWLGQSEQAILVRAALQVYCMFLDSVEVKGEREVVMLQTPLSQIIKTSVGDNASGDWELLYFALQTHLKICQSSPSTAFSAKYAPIWISIRQCLAFPHVWVKLTAAKILGTSFADFAKTNASSEGGKLPLKGSGGLLLSADEMVEVARISLRSLRVTNLNEELATQSVRNLVFIGRNIGDTAVGRDFKQVQVTQAVEEDSEDELAEEMPESDTPKIAVQFIFERASAIIRRGPLTTKAPALVPMKAAIQLIGALCNHLPVAVIARSIHTILLPLQNLTDPSIPTPFSSDEAFTTSYKGLMASSSEIMTLLQKKLGTTQYIANLAKVREGVKERREGRRIKRRIEAVAQPERVGVLKKRKGEKKREKRKERSGEERGRRRGW